MNLTYDAIDASGRQINDAIEAESSRAAVELLRRKGLFVTHIERSEGGAAATARGAGPRALPPTRRVSLKVLTLFTRQMAMLLRSGSAVVPALWALARQMRRKEHIAMIEHLKLDLEEGSTLSEALRKFPNVFDPTYCAVVAAGEASANLGEMFSRLAVLIGKRRAMRNKILGALAYPLLLTCLCGVVINILLFFVVPRFGDMFKTLGAQLPSSTSFLLDLSEVIRRGWPLGVAALLALLIGTVLLVTTQIGRQWLANIQVRLPLIGRLRARLIQAQVFRILGMLIESRVGVLDALDLARRVTRNARFQTMFDGIESAVTGGGNMSVAMEVSRLVAPSICQAIHTGEESGKLGEAISFVADVLDEENTELVGVLTKLMEPLILMLMGVVVGGVAISLFMPLFDLTSAVR
jgi:type II secretory pathway component PulF